MAWRKQKIMMVPLNKALKKLHRKIRFLNTAAENIAHLSLILQCPSANNFQTSTFFTGVTSFFTILKRETESLFYLTWQLTFLKPTLNFIKFMKFMNL